MQLPIGEWIINVIVLLVVGYIRPQSIRVMKHLRGRIMQSIVPQGAELDLAWGSDFEVVVSVGSGAAEVLELEDLVDEGRCAEVECRWLRVHEATHHNEAQHDLENYENVVYAVHRDLVGKLDWLDEGDNAEWDYEEDCEDYEGDQLGELNH